MRPFPVDVDSLLTVFALDFGHAALTLAVEFHILSIKSETAPLPAGLQNSVTFRDVVYGIFIGRNIFAQVICASELHLLQVLIHSTVHFSPFYSVVTLAFFGAMVVFGGPRLDAIRAENRLATAALFGVFYHEGADWANEKVGSVFLRLIEVNEVLDVQFFLAFV
jgi:hypothetical protein